MTQDPLRTTLDTLRSERVQAELRAIELDEELQAVGQRLTHLRGAIENIEALLGIPSVEDEAAVSYTRSGSDDDYVLRGATPKAIGVDFTNVEEGAPHEPAARKRVPSTEWVAEVVGQIGHPADRDLIFGAFKDIKGFPKTWTNPRNSINNALNRAVERRMVLKLEDNLFAPLNYNPFEDYDQDREESR